LPTASRTSTQCATVTNTVSEIRVPVQVRSGPGLFDDRSITTAPTFGCRPTSGSPNVIADAVAVPAHNRVRAPTGMRSRRMAQILHGIPL